MTKEQHFTTGSFNIMILRIMISPAIRNPKERRKSSAHVSDQPDVAFREHTICCVLVIERGIPCRVTGPGLCFCVSCEGQPHQHIPSEALR